MEHGKEVKTEAVKYTWNKYEVCQAAREQLRVKNGRGRFLGDHPLSASRETSYSFQNTEVSWSPPLPRPPKSSGRSACLFAFELRSALVFSHPALLSIFFTRPLRSFVSVSFARLQSEEHRGTIHALNESSLLREKNSRNWNDEEFIWRRLRLRRIKLRRLRNRRLTKIR